MDVEFVDKIFREYTSQFDMSEMGIFLKYEHTFEVVKISEAIAKKRKLKEEDIKLAKVIAYLHDIGRFEQLQKTKTFKDAIMDHADNGVDLLFNRGLIKKFQIDEKYYDIISKSIRNHNKLKIEEELEEDEKLFVKLIRDADKIDIYRVCYKYNNLFFHDSFLEKPQEINLQSFYNHQSIDIKNCKNKSDAVLCRIAFVFDLNFGESIEVLKELDYFSKYLNNLEVSSEEEKVFVDVKNEVYKYLNSKEEW